MNKSIEELEIEYNSCFSLYSEFCKQISEQLNKLMEVKEVILASKIETRVKTFDSIIEKLERNNLEVGKLSEINDLAGIRIITLFKRDIEVINKIIEDNFVINRLEDTSKRLSEDQFGYGSIHLEVSVKDEWLQVPSFRIFKGLNLEIQVRTSSQHLWAASSHKLQYKHEKDVPTTLVRAINRVAALLEVVDLEFERALEERENYIKNIDSSTNDEIMNVDTLKFLLDNLLPTKNLSKSEASAYSELLTDLQEFGIDTAESLTEVIKNNYHEMLERENKFAKSKGTEVYFNRVGLVRAAMRSQFKDSFEEYLSDKLRKKNEN